MSSDIVVGSTIEESNYLPAGGFRIKDRYFDCFRFKPVNNNHGPRFDCFCIYCNCSKRAWTIGEMKTHLSGVQHGQAKVSFCDPDKSPLWEKREEGEKTNKKKEEKL